MALFGNVGDDYTKTGKGGLNNAANFLTYIPLVGGITKKIFGSTISSLLGYVDTIIETGKWLFQGKFGSAATVLTAGVVSNTINGVTGPIMWGANALSGATTGANIGTHARALTEGVIGSVTGALGVKPTVLASYPAAIGSIGGDMTSGRAPQASFRDQIAAERGMTREQMDARADQAYVNNTQSSNQLGA